MDINQINYELQNATDHELQITDLMERNRNLIEALEKISNLCIISLENKANGKPVSFKNLTGYLHELAKEALS